MQPNIWMNKSHYNPFSSSLVSYQTTMINKLTSRLHYDQKGWSTFRGEWERDSKGRTRLYIGSIMCMIILTLIPTDEHIIRTHSVYVWISRMHACDGWACLQMRWDNVRVSYTTDCAGNEPLAGQVHNEGQIDYTAPIGTEGNLLNSSRLIELPSYTHQLQRGDSSLLSLA